MARVPDQHEDPDPVEPPALEVEYDDDEPEVVLVDSRGNPLLVRRRRRAIGYIWN